MKKNSQISIPKIHTGSSRRPFVPLTYKMYCIAVILGCSALSLMLFLWPMNPVRASSTRPAPIFQPMPQPTTLAPSTPQVGNNASVLGGTYHDPQGLYSIPVPQNWNSTHENEYLILTSPDDQIQLYILTIPDQRMNTAIDLAWKRVDSNFAMPLKHRLAMPSLNGLEEILTITYDDGMKSGELVLALAQQHKGIAYVVLTRGLLTSFEKRAAQIRLIQTGFTINSLVEPTLQGVKPQKINAAILAELEHYIIALLARYHVPGASVAIVQDDQIVYKQGFGLRQLGRPEVVQPSTQMMIGSIGKTMTTMMVATLVDSGLLQWDTPVVEVLPTFRVADPQMSRKLTIRNLFCSCTGVPRRDFELFFRARTLSAEKVIESLEKYELFTNFGETFQYSNQMVAVGGYAAAAASGGHYGHLHEQYVSEMERRIFAPIHMSSSTFSFEEVVAGGNYAQPHSVNLQMDFAPLPLYLEEVVIPVAPAGGAWSTVEDLGYYLLTLLNSGITPEGKQVVSPWNLGITWLSQVPFSANTSYGLGWFVDEYKGVHLLHHGGNTMGFTSDLAFLPEADLGIVVLTNAQGVNFLVEAIRYRLLELVYAQEQRYDAYAHYRYTLVQQYLGDAESAIIPFAPQDVAIYLGNYTNAELGAIQLRLWDDNLQLVTNEGVVDLRPQRKENLGIERYVVYNPPLVGLPVHLKQNEQGEPIIVLGAGVTQYTFERAVYGIDNPTSAKADSTLHLIADTVPTRHK